MNRFMERRKKLVENYGDTVFLIPSGRELMRSHSVAHRFKATSDFFYLTGIDSVPGAILLLAGSATHLFVPAQVQSDVTWRERSGLDDGDLIEAAGVAMETCEKLPEIAENYLAKKARLALPIGRDAGLTDLALSLIGYRRSRRNGSPSRSLSDSRPLIGTVRLQKDSDEIDCLREASRRSSRVHARLMNQPLAGRTEIEVANFIEAGLLMEGMRWSAYETIVGSGERSTILHARATDRIIRENELLVVDAGGEWQGYCSDITRTLPADTRFSREQRQVYSLVLKAQKAALKIVEPGRTLDEIELAAREQIHDGVPHLFGGAKDLLSETLLPHKVSHWLGLDVHDSSPYQDDAGRPIKLAPGMCLTVEPGIYLGDLDPAIGCRPFGIRIEDDVLVTQDGHEVLSCVPKEIEEVEELRSRWRS